MSDYLLLTKAFCQTNQNYSNSIGSLGYGITISGDYVASRKTYDDFPELFTGEIELPGISIVQLSPSDFPQINMIP